MIEKQPEHVPTDYKFYKKAGIFDVFGKTAESGWKDKGNGFELKPGDYFYELHLYNKPEGPLLEQAEQSMQELADCIRQAKYKPKVVLAFTYEKLGKISTRRGFKEAETQIPNHIIEDVEESYHRTSPLSKKGFPPGKTMLIYQPVNNLLAKY